MRGTLALGLLAVGLAHAADAPQDGTAQAVVAGPGSHAMPAWAPGGGQLVFHSRRRDEKQRGVASRNVWIVNADGSGERKLTSGTKDEFHPALSPDGRKLVFVSELNGSRDIWIADADGQNPVPVSDDPGGEDQPAWSPDSHQIVYAAFPREGGSFDLWLVNADGSGRRRLTTTAANEIFPAWHPNGELVAYVTDAGGNLDLYTIDVRDAHTTPLVVTPDHEARPAWSADGTKIAFARWPVRGRTADSTLWVANADGTVPVELTAAPAPATHPAWSPDGQTLAFQHRAEEGWQIWVLSLPADLVQRGRLRLAQQVRGGADVDTVKLRTGETVRGTLRASSFRLRTPYAAVELTRAMLASVLFDERGLARAVLANGDSLSGFLEAGELHVAAGSRTEVVPAERVAQLSLRAGSERRVTSPVFRAAMRNGDSLSLTAFGPLRLRVGGRPMELGSDQIERVETATGGTKADVTLRGGDRLSGDLVSERLPLVLAGGPHLSVDPSTVRNIVRVVSSGAGH